MFTKIISKKTILAQLKHVADYMTANALMLDLTGKEFSEAPEKYQTRVLNLLNTLCVEKRAEKVSAPREPDKWKWVQDEIRKQYYSEKTLKERKKRAAKRR